jgi:hypothetical protein
MTEEQTEKNNKSGKPRRHLLRIFLVIFGLFLAGIYFTLFFGFNYFGEKFLRDFLQARISKSSSGLYNVDFRKLNFNIITGKVTIDSFELIPDTHLYNNLKAKGLITKSLYRVSLESVDIDRIHFWQIYTQQRVNLQQVVFNRPVISIVGFPDTTTAKKTRWRVIYEDLYPAVSNVFNDFHVDSVKVNHGLLLTVFRQKTGKLSTGEYEFSTVLRDVSVNPFSYYNRERVFYSRDIDWTVHDFEYIMADSLYFLRATEIGFSLKKSRLFATDLSLRPNFAMRWLHKSTAGDFYSIHLPSLMIEGVDLYRALIDKEVEIKTLDLTGLKIKVYHNLLTREVKKVNKKRVQFKIAGLYTIIDGLLKNLAIDTLKIQRASFEYFAHLNDRRPEIRIGSVEVGVNGFFLDSAAHFNKQKIFYSGNIEFTLGDFNLNLRDQVHKLSAGKVYISTARSLLVVKDMLLFPENNMNVKLNKERKNTISLLIPSLIFQRLNLIKLFNYRIFKFDLLEIDEPDLTVTRYQKSAPPNRRFNNPEDFFEEKNEDFLFDLIKKYLFVVEGNKIDLENGHVEIVNQQDHIERTLATARIDLQMMNFLIDSTHGMNRQGYFYSRDFNLNINSVSAQSPDGLLHLNIRKGNIITVDSLITAEDIVFERSEKPNYNLGFRHNRSVIDMRFSLKKLYLTGLNHRKLFLERILKAGTINLETPFLSLKSEIRETDPYSTTEAQFIHPRKIIRDFEIGSMMVQHGAFTYDGAQDKKATYFSMKDIDFILLNSKIHIPERGKGDGVIRFDSLKLTIFPFRAAIADSTYLLECRKLDFHSYPSDITLSELTIRPVSINGDRSNKSSLISVTIPELKLKGFYFDKAIFNNEWRLSRVYADHPFVNIEILKSGSAVNGQGIISQSYSINPPPFIKTLSIQDILVKGAELQLSRHKGNGIENTSLKDIFFNITQVRVDSTTIKTPGKTPLFNAEDIVFSAPGLKRTNSDSTYTFAFQRFGFSTREKSAYIDSLSITPNYGRTEFPHILGHQADRLEISIPGIVLTGIDFLQFLDSGQIIAKKAVIQNLHFSAYRDKRVRLPLGPTPLMPQQMVNRINFPMEIDTIMLKNGEAVYEEQIGNEPGRVFFNNMDMLITGFNTIKSRNKKLAVQPALNVHGTTFLMGTAPVEAWFWFPLDHPRDSFNFKANVGVLNMRDLNPIVSKLIPVFINSGEAEKTSIHHIHANTNYSKGFMDVTFSGLSIRMENTGAGTVDQIKNALMTEVVNILIPDQNPREDGRKRTGVIYYERDTSKSFFNFVWKSTLSGLKSSAGFNNKIQRQIRKAERKSKY